MCKVTSDTADKTKKEINTMLECLLSKDSNCRSCKNCENVDACCFLMEAVVVSKHIKKSKSNSTL
jgi:hypothetical protein